MGLLWFLNGLSIRHKSRRIMGLVANKELERMWNVVDVSWEVLRRTMSMWCRGLYLNPGPTADEVGPRPVEGIAGSP